MTLRYYAESSGPVLVITHQALARMLRFQQLHLRDKEAGGQLFARFNGSEIIIVEATTPKTLDYRARHSFRPNRWLQRREIKNRYLRASHFVGDWHTHPESLPSPSPEDIAGMLDCFHRSTHDLNAFVLIILGTNPPPWGLYVGLVGAQGVQTLHCKIDSIEPVFLYEDTEFR